MTERSHSGDWGSNDGVIPVKHAHVAHAAMPGSVLEIFEGAGHFPHHAEPERFVDLLRTFVATTAPAEYDPDYWQELLRQGRPGSDSSLDDELPELTLATLPAAKARRTSRSA